MGVHWVVVDNASPALHAVLWWLFPSLRGERNRQFTGEEVLFNDHLSVSRVTAPGTEDAAVTSTKSAEVWSGLATLYPEEMKNKHSQKGKSRLRLLMAAAKIQKYQWYLNNARLRSTVACKQAALLGTGTCGNEAVSRRAPRCFQAGGSRVGAHIQAEA